MPIPLATLKTEFDTFINYSLIVDNKNYMQTFRHGGDAYWHLLWGESNLAAFQATGDLTYLNNVLEHWYAFQDGALPSNTFPSGSLPAYNTGTGPGSCTGSINGEIIGNSHQTFSDTFLSWDNHGCRRYTQGWTDGGEYPLFETHGFQYIPKLLQVLHVHGSLRALGNTGCSTCKGSTYQSDYESILSFFEANVWDKWDVKGSNPRGGPIVGTNENLMRSTTHISSHASNMALYLYKVTGAQKYKDFLDDWNDDLDGHGYNSSTAAGFRGQLRDHAYTNTGTTYNGYIWSGGWGSLTGSTDTNHCQAEIRHIANQLMFSDNVWETEKSKFIETVRWLIDDSQGDAHYLLTAVANGNDGDESAMLYYGAVCWGRFSETVQTELENTNIFSVAVASGLRERKLMMLGNMMYNRAYLDGTLVYPEYVDVSVPVLELGPKIKSSKSKYGTSSVITKLGSNTALLGAIGDSAQLP